MSSQNEINKISKLIDGMSDEEFDRMLDECGYKDNYIDENGYCHYCHNGSQSRKCL